jgi:anti-anti-sigma factor
MIESPAMQVPSRRFGEAVVLSPSGPLDHSTAEAFQSALLARLDSCVAGGDRVVLDLAGVDYIASVGLRVLMLASRKVKAQGGTLVLAAMQPVVKEIFDISRFAAILEAFPTVREALAKVAPGALSAFDLA